MAKIMLVEDDPVIAKSLSISLPLRGFQITVAMTLSDAKENLDKDSFDLILLDINLPDGSGFDLCQEIRKNNTLLPILMLTAKTDEGSVVKGISIGADDYVRKPFGLDELAVRIKRLLGRGIEQKNILGFGSIRMNLNNRVVFAGEKPLNLAKRGFEILEILLKKSGQDVSRESILAKIDDEGKIFDRTLDSHVCHLRQRFRDVGACDIQITSVYGIGYRLERT